MQNKNSYIHFLNALRARGGMIPHYDLGGGVGLASVAAPGSALPVNPEFGRLGIPNAGAGPQLTQGGIGGALTPQNQYSAQLAPTQFLNYAPVANQAANQALAGYDQSQGNIRNEQNLAQLFQAQAEGRGPSVATARLNEATGRNVANQAALAAGQRGAGANVGLISREAARTGSALEQEAAGQAATLQAQEMLAARQNQAALQGQIGQQIAQEQGINTGLLGTTAGATNAQNQASIANYAQMQGTNAAIAAANAQAAQKTTGGLLGGVASAVGSLFGAEGGEVPDMMHMADGGATPIPSDLSLPSDGPTSFVGKFLSGIGQSSNTDPFAAGMSNLGAGVGRSIQTATATPLPSDLTGMLSHGGGVDIMVSPGEKLYTPDEATQVAKGGKVEGTRVPGKAKVPGDSLENDIVPMKAQPGTIVVPRTKVDKPSKETAFVQAIQAKQGLKRKR